MPYLLPPMADEPPPEFVEFVAVHLGDLQAEAARLVGGPGHAQEVYPEALADVAGHWRRLRLRRRLTRRDAPGAYLHRRLATHAERWRDEQIYEVDVRPLREHATAARPSSVALRKAPLLPDTVRRHARPLAEASIAWAHAYRRHRWHVVARIGVVLFVALVALAQAAPALPD
jgi:hypothetical protein